MSGTVTNAIRAFSKKLQPLTKLTVLIGDFNFNNYQNIEKRISDIYLQKDNPFIFKYYLFNTLEYLKSLGLINRIPPRTNKKFTKIYSRDDYRIIYQQSINRTY
tara:strand:- start:1234 stop:1545 length:312 start_codon:yes stop_codon:yes gene_type:complete